MLKIYLLFFYFFYFYTYGFSTNLLLSPYSVTINQGLKSNNIHDIHIDKHGRLWVASSMGLSLYNGLNCKTYNIKDGLPDNEIHEIFEDEIGRIWVVTNTCKLAYIDQDILIQYPYNNLIADFKKRRSDHHTDFFVDASDNVRLSINTIGKIEINNKGQSKTRRESIKSEQFKSQYIQEIGPNKYFFYTEDVNISPKYRGTSQNFFTWSNGIKTSTTQDRDLTLCYFDYAQYGDTTFVSIGKYLHYLYKNKIIKTEQFESSIISIAINKHTILLSLHSNGVKSLNLKNSKKNEWISHLTNITCTKIIPNKSTGYWISTIGHGVLFISNLSDLKFNFGEKIISSSLNDSTYYFGSEKGSVYKLKPSIGNLNIDSNKVLSNPVDELICIDNHSLYIRSSKNIYRCEKNKIFSISCPQNSCNIKRLLKSANGNVLGLGNSIYLILKDRLINTNAQTFRTYFTDILHVNEDYFAGAFDGLYYHNTDSLVYLGNSDKNLKYNITSLEVFKDEFLLIGTNSNGLILYNIENGKSYTITESIENFNNINSIKKISKTRFIIRSGTYLIELLFDDDLNYALKWAQPFYGVFSLNNKMIIQDSTILTLYDNEAIIFNYSSLFQELPNLSITNPEILVNNEKILKNQNLLLSYNENSIRINLEVVRLIESSDIIFNYKLHNYDKEWLETTEPFIQLDHLSPGNYQITIKAISKNDNRESDQVVILAVLSPPMWESPWIISFLVFSLLFFGLSRYFQRLRRVELNLLNKIESNDKIVALELNALRSQINSHFIFNILNGIKSLIVENKEKIAVNYLIRFSALLRDILNNSFKRTISLDEELSALKNYVLLENLRFNDRISLSIHIDKKLDPTRIRLPSLILQPFVENSIIHGFKDKSKGGQIVVNISSSMSILEICIRDNGIGRKIAQNSSNKEHIGVKNTARRVEIVNQLFGSNHVGVRYIDHTKKDKSTGTEVIIKIKI